MKGRECVIRTLEQEKGELLMHQARQKQECHQLDDLSSQVARVCAEKEARDR